MDEKQIFKVFTRFLKDHKAYGGFIKNRLIRGYKRNNYDIEYVIIDGFCWGYTPEGSEFWGKLHLNWEKVYRSIKQRQK